MTSDSEGPARRQGGFVFLFTLGIILFLVTGAAWLLVRSSSELNISERALRTVSAFHLAEAAADRAMSNLSADNTANIASTSLSQGTYWAELTSLGGQQYQIAAHGSIAAERRDLEVIVERAPKSVFAYALFGYDQLDVKNSAVTDSYNSTQGNYNPSAPGTKGGIGTNNTATQSVKLDNGAAINGQVAVGPGMADPSAAVEIKNGAVITSTPQIVSQSQVLAKPTVSTTGLSCGTKLELKHGETFTLEQAHSPYCYTEVQVDNSSVLLVSGHVQLYTGKLVVKNEAEVNYSATSKPATQLVVQITSDNKVLLDNSAKFVGAIYAPNSDADVKNSAILYGSLIAKKTVADNSAYIHYDEALKELGPTGSYTIAVKSWRDL